jgi:hypothetical protein
VLYEHRAWPTEQFPGVDYLPTVTAQLVLRTTTQSSLKACPLPVRVYPGKATCVLHHMSACKPPVSCTSALAPGTFAMDDGREFNRPNKRARSYTSGSGPHKRSRTRDLDTQSPEAHGSARSEGYHESESSELINNLSMTEGYEPSFMHGTIAWSGHGVEPQDMFGSSPSTFLISNSSVSNFLTPNSPDSEFLNPNSLDSNSLDPRSLASDPLNSTMPQLALSTKPVSLALGNLQDDLPQTIDTYPQLGPNGPIPRVRPSRTGPFTHDSIGFADLAYFVHLFADSFSNFATVHKKKQAGEVNSYVKLSSSQLTKFLPMRDNLAEPESDANESMNTTLMIGDSESSSVDDLTLGFQVATATTQPLVHPDDRMMKIRELARHDRAMLSTLMGDGAFRTRPRFPIGPGPLQPKENDSRSATLYIPPDFGFDIAMKGAARRFWDFCMFHWSRALRDVLLAA